MKKIQVHCIVATDKSGQFIAEQDKRVESSTTWTAQGDQKFFARQTSRVAHENGWNLLVAGRQTYDTFKDTKFVTSKGLGNRQMVVLTRALETFQSPNPLVQARSIDNVEAFLQEVSGYEGLEQIFIIGGTQVYDLFLRAGVVDSIFYSVHKQITFAQGIPFVSDSDCIPKFNHRHILHEYPLVTIYQHQWLGGREQ
jgi:dihydrofolate reductase